MTFDKGIPEDWPEPISVPPAPSVPWYLFPWKARSAWQARSDELNMALSRRPIPPQDLWGDTLHQEIAQGVLECVKKAIGLNSDSLWPYDPFMCALFADDLVDVEALLCMQELFGVVVKHPYEKPVNKAVTLYETVHEIAVQKGWQLPEPDREKLLVAQLACDAEKASSGFALLDRMVTDGCVDNEIMNLYVSDDLPWEWKRPRLLEALERLGLMPERRLLYLRYAWGVMHEGVLHCGTPVSGCYSLWQNRERSEEFMRDPFLSTLMNTEESASYALDRRGVYLTLWFYHGGMP